MAWDIERQVDVVVPETGSRRDQCMSVAEAVRVGMVKEWLRRREAESVPVKSVHARAAGTGKERKVGSVRVGKAIAYKEKPPPLPKVDREPQEREQHKPLVLERFGVDELEKYKKIK